VARKATIVGHVDDFDGSPWDVRERRRTRHGFDVLIGWPKGQRGPGCGGPRLIPTRELIVYFDRHRLTRDGAAYDLPVCRSTVKRVRQLLGLNYYVQNEEWWIDRLHDLIDMPGRTFCAVHGVSESMASIMRNRLVGRRTRLPGWWREAEAARLLRSDLPRSYVAEKLDISIGAVGRLRWILRREPYTVSV
jgi:hypothetical protein